MRMVSGAGPMMPGQMPVPPMSFSGPGVVVQEFRRGTPPKLEMEMEQRMDEYLQQLRRSAPEPPPPQYQGNLQAARPGTVPRPCVRRARAVSPRAAVPKPASLRRC